MEAGKVLQRISKLQQKRVWFAVFTISMTLYHLIYNKRSEIYLLCPVFEIHIQINVSTKKNTVSSLQLNIVTKPWIL